MSVKELNRARENVAALSSLNYDKQQMKEIIKKELMEFINKVEQEINKKNDNKIF
jgi:hypothetical protein